MKMIRNELRKIRFTLNYLKDLSTIGDALKEMPDDVCSSWRGE